MATAGLRQGVGTVSVVIPTRGRAPTLRRVIAGALADAAVLEVIVVLDPGARRDGALASLGDIPVLDGRTRVVVAAGRGPGPARAEGAAVARGDVILFLDDDVVPGPGLPSGHLGHHVGCPGLVVVGPMPVAGDRLARSATARVYARDYARVLDGYQTAAADVLADLWAGNVSMRRDDCLRVGVVNPRFPHGQHEDRDLGLRCRDAGFVGRFDPTLVAHHRYVRGAGAFLRLAREQAIATRALHAVHADVLGPFAPDQYRRGVPPRLQWLLDAGAPAASERGLLAVLRILRAAAHVVAARRLEDRALVLSRALVQHRAVRQATPPEPTAAQCTTSDAMPATIITNPSTM